MKILYFPIVILAQKHKRCCDRLHKLPVVNISYLLVSYTPFPSFLAVLRFSSKSHPSSCVAAVSCVGLNCLQFRSGTCIGVDQSVDCTENSISSRLGDVSKSTWNPPSWETCFGIMREAWRWHYEGGQNQENCRKTEPCSWLSYTWGQS